MGMLDDEAQELLSPPLASKNSQDTIRKRQHPSRSGPIEGGRWGVADGSVGPQHKVWQFRDGCSTQAVGFEYEPSTQGMGMGKVLNARCGGMGKVFNRRRGDMERTVHQRGEDRASWWAGQ